MRKLLVAVAAVLVVLAAVVAWAMSSFERRVAARVADVGRQISEGMRLEMQVKDVGVTWLPRPAVAVDAVLTTRKQAGSHVVVDNARVVVVPRLASLLAGREEVESVEVDKARFVTRFDQAESALRIAPLLREATLPVRLRDCTIQIDRGSGLPVVDIQNVELDLVPHDGVVDYRGTLSPLGERSHGDIAGTWSPGSGHTGGDGFKIDLKVRDGDPASILKYVPELTHGKFTDEVTLDLAAQGFLGERSTETLPAEPLAGRVHAEVGLDILGLDRRAVFDSGVTLDDKRLVLHEGEGKWGERPFTFAGWIQRGIAVNKMNLRMSVKDVSVADVLAEYGIAERWRPKAQVTGEIRLEGSFDYPLARYNAKAPSVTFDAWPSLPIASGPMTVRGSLLAVNVDVSGSFESDTLKVGDVSLPHVLVGSRWWRNKLTVTSMGLPVWGGKFDGSAAYEPGSEQGTIGGGLLHDVDAKLFLEHVYPDSGLQLEGRLDASFDGHYRDGVLSYRGRAGVHEGTLGPKGLLRSVANEVAASAGVEPAAIDELAPRHPALSPERLRFRRIAADFKSMEQGTGVRVADLLTDGATLTLDGSVDGSKRVSTAGVATFVPPLSTDLARHIPPLAKLATEDGKLQVPLRVDGPPADLHVTLDERFVSELRKAAEGKNVRPFVAVPPERSFQIEEDLQSLEEQFGR